MAAPSSVTEKLPSSFPPVSVASGVTPVGRTAATMSGVGSGMRSANEPSPRTTPVPSVRVWVVRPGDTPSCAVTACVPTVQVKAPFTSGLLKAPRCSPGVNQVGGGEGGGLLGSFPPGVRKFCGPYGMFAFWFAMLLYEKTATCWPFSVATPSTLGCTAQTTSSEAPTQLPAVTCTVERARVRDRRMWSRPPVPARRALAGSQVADSRAMTTSQPADTGTDPAPSS